MYLICAVYIASSHLGIIVEACNYFESCKSQIYLSTTVDFVLPR